MNHKISLLWSWASPGVADYCGKDVHLSSLLTGRAHTLLQHLKMTCLSTTKGNLKSAIKLMCAFWALSDTTHTGSARPTTFLLSGFFLTAYLWAFCKEEGLLCDGIFSSFKLYISDFNRLDWVGYLQPKAEHSACKRQTRTRGWQHGGDDRSHLVAHEGPHSPPFAQYSWRRETSPAKTSPRFKKKQSTLPNKFLLICQSRRGALRVMDVCPSRSWMWRSSVLVFARAGRTSKGLPATPSGVVLRHPRCILFTVSNISPGTSHVLLQMKCFSLLLFSFDFILIVCHF